MKNRSVVKLLASLGQRNINTLDSYLHSFYSNQDCVRLFDAIKDCAPKFSSKKMQIELVWQRCFPTKKLTSNRFDKLCFALQGHVKEFMAWQEMKEDSVVQGKLFLKAANRYEMSEEIEGTLEELVPLIKKIKKTDIWANHDLIEAYHQLYFSIDLMRKKDKGKQAFINIVENLDAFYLTYRTLLEVEKNSRDYVIIEEMQEFNFKKIRDLLKLTSTTSKEKENELFQTLESFVEEEWGQGIIHYELIEEKVFNLMPKLDLLSQEILMNSLSILGNFYSKQGILEFLPKIFRIRKYTFDSGSAIKNNLISYTSFLNIIDTGSKVNEIDWVESFCKNYQKYLSKGIRVETVRLAEAIIAFGKGDFKKAKELLEGKRHSLTQQNNRSRWVLTKTYYELKDDKLVEECDAFYQFLYREKNFSERARRGTLNFLKTIEYLINPNVNKSEIIRFVETCKVISQWFWLSQKIEERKF